MTFYSDTQSPSQFACEGLWAFFGGQQFPEFPRQPSSLGREKTMPKPKPKTAKLSVELIVRNYRERYETIAVKLHQWEQDKAAFLVGVGADCLTLVRAALEPFAEHELTERKAARADLIKQIEAQLPDVEGIGAPQVNR